MNSNKSAIEAPTYHAVVTVVLFVLSLGSVLVYWMSGDPAVFGAAGTLFVVSLVLGIYALIGGFVGKAARRKGRSFHAFFWLSLLVNPLIMAIVVAAISPATPSNPPDMTGASSHELERLVSLHNSGSMTDEEFATAKQRLLDG